MALRRQATAHDDAPEIIRYYRELLNEPHRPPEFKYPPVHLGPTWETDEKGRFALPQRSLGWESMAWAGQRLQLKRGLPWRFTAEQARMWLWWYAVDDQGSFIFDREGIIQRLKGHGKDPWGAVYCANELVGPSRFDGWHRGKPKVVDEPDAWVQVLAVTQKQTANTMRLFPRLFTDDAKAEYGLAIGKEQIYAHGDQQYLQALTSNPDPLEGGRPTATLANETHLWKANNNGLAMYAVLERNSAKSNEGASRILQLSNAFEPGGDSLLERTRNAYELAQARPGEVLLQGVMYDSLEANPEAPLIDDDDPDVIEKVVESVRGDSVWLNVKRIRKSVEDPRKAPSESRRFWYNQITANEESFINPLQWDPLARPELPLKDRDEIVMFFDGSKSDDATALVGVRVSDGLVVTLGLWQAPPLKRRGTWTSPRALVNQRVRAVMKQYKVVAFFADPSHTREDGTLDRYWQPLVDEWHRDFGKQLLVWAQPGKHAVSFDMSNRHGEGKKFVEAAERFVEDVDNGDLLHDGNPELARHVKNARRFPTQHGVSLMKDGPESPRKIDLAVCAVGARMLWVLILNLAGKRKSGTVW